MAYSVTCHRAKKNWLHFFGGSSPKDEYLSIQWAIITNRSEEVLLTETFHRDSGLYVLIVLAESHVVRAFRGRVANNVCEGSERVKKQTYWVFVAKRKAVIQHFTFLSQQAPSGDDVCAAIPFRDVVSLIKKWRSRGLDNVSTQCRSSR